MRHRFPRRCLPIRGRGAVLLALVMAPIALASAAAAAAEVPSFALAGPTTLTAAGVVSEQDPAAVIATNRRGDAVVAWKVFRHGPAKDLDFISEVQVAFHAGTDADGVWSPPQRISAPDWRANPDWMGGPVLVGIDATGIATISWTEIGQSPLSVGVRQRLITHGPTGFSAVQEVVPTSNIQWQFAMAVAPDRRVGRPGGRVLDRAGRSAAAGSARPQRSPG